MGSVAALLVLAAFLRLTTVWRITLVTALILVAVGYLLWSRRPVVQAQMRAGTQAHREPAPRAVEEESP
jgi:hypothetical protein